MQTMPSSIHRHRFATSAPQVAASAWPPQASATSVVEPSGVGAFGLLEALPLTPTLPAPQAQSQGAQLSPGGHAGQTQVHVAPLVPLVAVVPPLHDPPLPQSQVHGAQASPGRHAGQVHVHVPPPPPLPPAGGFEHSHSTAGQSALVGHAIGCTQVQPPPDASRARQ
jgi:hypothetical protein